MPLRIAFILVAIVIFPIEVAAGAGIRHDFRADYVTIHVDKLNTVNITGCMAPTDDFDISKYEVTNTEYAAFLNAVARDTDPHRLYSPMQGQHFWGGIVKTLSRSSATYRVKQGYENLPVTFVSWFDAVRYVNWLHFGRPDTGGSEAGATEGSSTIGAYDTSDFGTTFHTPRRRNPNAKYFIPTCGEWIYAGFYDPATRALSRYVGGNSPPSSGKQDSTNRSANYYSMRWALPFPHLAAVNAYSNNRSALGTYNQAGNAMEWVETIKGDRSIALGGSLFLSADTLTVDYRDEEISSKKLGSFGFRVARAASGAYPDQSQVFSAEITSNAPLQTRKIATSQSTGLQEWEPIDHAGNVSDFQTGRGCVPHAYEMSRTEITNAQYAAFLNAVSRIEDRYQLYVDDMSTGVVGGIARSTRPDGYAYAPKQGYENRPATYISWFSLARYANWLHFGAPAGNQVIGITEGDATQGAYDTSGFESYKRDNGSINITRDTFTRNSKARYFIPSDDEWYKAAYYDPDRSGLRNYWNYPGRMNDAPVNYGDFASGANFQAETLGEGPPYFVSEVGAYKNRGYYHIYDLGGNVWEWLEDWRGLGGENCWRCNIPTKGLRGGSFNYINVGLWSRNVDPGVPSDHYFIYGGRLARRMESGASSWCVPSQMRHMAARTLIKAADHRLVIVSAFSLLLFAGIVGWRLARRRF